MVNTPIKITDGRNFVPGLYVIKAFSGPNTVTLERDPTNGSMASGGTGSVLSGPMIEVKQTIYGSVIRRLRMYGNPNVPPRSAVSYVGISDFGASQHYVEDVWIGPMVADSGFDASMGKPFYDGIYVCDSYDGGTADNNDVFSIRNGVIQDCAGAAIRQGSSQNLLMSVLSSQIKNCAYGVTVAAKLTLDNVFFSGQTKSDLYSPFADDYG